MIMKEDKILKLEESLNNIKDIGAFLTSGNNIFVFILQGEILIK